jgi:S1-C subfamily serine protease
MKMKAERFSVLMVLAVFLGGLAGSGFMYMQFQDQVDSLEHRVESNTNTRFVYINGSQGTFAPLYEEVDESVVIVNAAGNEASQGSGFIYNESGYIVTNEHVVDEADRVNVRFTDGSTREAQMVGEDPYTDLAVLKVSKRNLDPLPLADSNDVRPGQRAIAMGAPFGLDNSITVGYVSQVGRSLPVQEIGLEGFRIRDVIQTDAAINPGNSGGPLLNSQGEVIGVNTAIETETGTFSGIGFAVPSNTVERVVPQMINRGEARHPWIGIRGLSMNEELADAMDTNQTSGFLVMNTSIGGPAERAGLRGGNTTEKINGINYRVGGDIIVAIDGQEMQGYQDIITFLARKASVGEDVTVTVLRDGERVDIPLVLEDRPEEEEVN